MIPPQYPHFLFVVETPDSVQDENGNWTEPGEATRRMISRCRAESGGKGAEFAVAGGEFRKSEATIYAPKSCPSVSVGAEIIVSNDKDCTDIRISGVCLNCDPTFFHVRLWV